MTKLLMSTNPFMTPNARVFSLQSSSYIKVSTVFKSIILHNVLSLAKNKNSIGTLKLTLR